MTGAFCGSCGQDSLTGPHPLVRSLRRQWDRVRHSAVALVVHPGQLTAEFRDGQRARSVAPWRIAFNLVTFFFVLSFVTDFRVANFARQDPSGTLKIAIATAAQQANVDLSVYTERVDRRFDAIYTLFVVLLVAVSAVLVRATHWQPRVRWGIHFVFALHFTAWTFIANFVFYAAMRLFDLSTYTTSSDPHVQVGGLVLVTLILLWQFSYLLLAFRRVYADGWLGGAAKAALVVALKLVTGNAIAVLAIWLTIQSLKRVG
jgi:hypothetical protein